jgi:hypothetical protein
MNAHPITQPARLPGPPRLPSLLNGGLERLWRAGLLPFHRSAEQWLAAVEKRAEGPERDFIGDLRHLIRSLDPDHRLTFLGRRGLWGLLEEAIRRNRRVAADFETHPEISEVAIVRPIFIVGMPRTGTTFLQMLLSRVPGCRWLAPWELELPFPRRGDWGGSGDRRRRSYERSLARLRRRTDLDAIHPVDSPAECWRLFVPTFLCHTLFLFFGFEGYRPWVEGLTRERARAAYAHYRRQLQHLAWQAPGSPFVLKAPEHAFNLPALLEAFPDASVVLLHRDPLDVVPSFSSLAWHCQCLCLAEPDPAAVGRGALATLGHCGERILAARRTLNPDRFYDLHYRDLVRDPLGAAAGIYAHCGRPLGAEVRAALARWLEDRGRTPRSRHRYALDDFALTPGDVDRAFADYRDYFEVPLESAA